MKKLIVCLAASSVIPVATFAAPTAYETAVLANNPYVFYRLGEASGTTVTDSSGNNRDGTYVGSPTLGGTGGGPGSDSAASFSGSAQNVSSSALAGFGPLLGNSSFEFVFSTTTTASQMGLGGVLNTGSVTAWEITLNRTPGGQTAANGVRIFLRDDSANAIGAGFTNAVAFDGNFHHLVFTYDMTGVDNASRLRAFLDGQEQTLFFASAGGNSTPGSGTLSSFNFDTAFGGRQNRATTDLFLNGSLDEVALYVTALSPTDITAHYLALIPEPTTWALAGLGLGLFLLARRQRG
jgi:hypothetical protein